ncbi:MAG: hypothetical protein FIB01_02875 [Gemmatimonadetes bacterium]|nr:hypothetical protein [Gemmatimonadota bacterium]
MSAIFPLAFASEEVSLLTAVIMGFLFGFTLERAGFGNARKLAGQFYLHDMTVFKVMFTAILVAMVGIYAFAALGWLDLALLWINPTFLWSQLVGGFLLGAGFIVSGLCPGTAVVSAVSGRVDAMVTFVGVFLGTFLFAVTVDAFPWLERLYHAGSLGTSLLSDLLGMPAPLLAALVVLGAGAAFLGAEWVERRMAGRYPAVENAPTVRPRLKLAVPGALAALALGATFAPAPHRSVPVPEFERMSAGDVARRIIGREPGLVLLDVRGTAAAKEQGLPGAQAASLDSTVVPVLAGLAADQLVVVYDADGKLGALPAGWPLQPRYAVLAGGLAAWRAEVLTPAVARDATSAERALVAEQNQLAAFFSGATVAAPAAAAPPPAAGGGGGGKKKEAGGC